MLSWIEGREVEEEGGYGLGECFVVVVFGLVIVLVPILEVEVTCLVVVVVVVVLVIVVFVLFFGVVWYVVDFCWILVSGIEDASLYFIHNRGLSVSS